MRFSEIKDRQVVTLDGADKVGYIANAYVSGDGVNVIGFAVTMRGLLAGHRVFSWDSLSSIGADAVTLPNAEALHEQNRSTLTNALSTESLFGAKVMTQRGDDLGSLADIEFDAGTGAVAEYILRPSLIERVEGKREMFTPTHIQSMSPKLVVVADDAVQRET